MAALGANIEDGQYQMAARKSFHQRFERADFAVRLPTTQ